MVYSKPRMVLESYYSNVVYQIYHIGDMQQGIICLHGIVVELPSILVKHHMKLCMVRKQHVKDGVCLAVMSIITYQKVIVQLRLVAQWNRVFILDMIQLETVQPFIAYLMVR